jgi:hypothetical protein
MVIRTTESLNMGIGAADGETSPSTGGDMMSTV